MSLSLQPSLLQTELQTNPVLEEEPLLTEIPEDPTDQDDDSDLLSQNTDWPVNSAPPDRPRLDARQALLESKVLPESLTDHLTAHLTLTLTEPNLRAAASEIIGNLDDDGFLHVDLSEIATSAQVSPAITTQALALVQSFHPPGVAARSLPESLLLQLHARGRDDSLECRIVRDYFDLLGKRKFAEIAAASHAPIEAVTAAAEIISHLSPRPGAAFAPDRLDLVVRPEASFIRDGDKWIPLLEGDILPRLRISDVYKDLLSDASADEQTRSYLKERIRSARFLMQSLERRQETLQKLLEVIAHRQSDYFFRGPSALHPLTMTEVAAHVGVHETTIGRAVANKYVRTPHGVVPLRFFFATALGGSNDFEPAVANTRAKEILAEIVGRENSAKPYSDSALEEMLRERGIPVARRTISKYRSELGILPTHLRRRS